jgi:pimeloyl-CoA dehydrogenase small subunit
MDFDLSEEQRLLKESVDRLIADRYSFEDRKKYMKEAGGWSRAMWSQYAEMGLLGLPFAEADGGMGGGPVETMIVMESFGTGLVLEPYFATVVLAGGFLRLAGSDAQRKRFVPKIAEGKCLMAFAQIEPQSRYDLGDVSTTAKRSGNDWVLDGKKVVVLHGDCADWLVVTARVAGSRRDRDGIGVFLVDAKAAGVTRRGYPTQDGLRAAEIEFKGVKVPAPDVIGEPGKALPLVEQVADQAIAALCAEAVGAMQVSQDTTVEYLKVRKQFGVPIGSFQALQHRAADMLIALEQARSMALFATMMAAEPDAAERRKSISAAKIQIGKSGRFIGQQSIQLHGGIGMTDEYKIGHYFKRLTMIELAFGDTDFHLSSLAEAGGLIAADTQA